MFSSQLSAGAARAKVDGMRREAARDRAAGAPARADRAERRARRLAERLGGEVGPLVDPAAVYPAEPAEPVLAHR